jgi:hypothetical protein
VERICPVCGSELPLSKRAHAQFCSVACAGRKRNRIYATAHPDRISLNREKQNANAEARMYNRIKSRAKISNIPFDISKDDIVIPDICPILKIPLIRYRGINRASGYFPDSPSLDRIKPELGYVKGNVRVISARANLLKNNASVQELTAVLADMRKIHYG